MGIAKPPFPSLLIPGHPLSPDMGCWLMNEGSGGTVHDISGRGNNGTLTSMESSDWIVKPPGWCLDFETDDRVKVPYQSSLFANNMTVVFACRSDITDYSSNAYVVSMYDYAGGNRMWGVIVLAATDLWTVIASDDGSQNDAYSSSVSVADSWQTFAFVVDNANHLWDMYHNGVYVETLDPNYTYADQGSFLTIGGLDASGNSFNGQIAYVNIYGRSLAASEISSLNAFPYQMVWQPTNIAYFVGAAAASIVPGLMSQYRRRRVA